MGVVILKEDLSKENGNARACLNNSPDGTSALYLPKKRR